MTTDEISRAAMTGCKPDGMNSAERVLWFELRDVYEQFRQELITRKQGEKYKDDILRQFEMDLSGIKEAERIIRWHADFWKRIEAAGIAYSMAEQRTPEGDDFYRAVYHVSPHGRTNRDALAENGPS